MRHSHEELSLAIDESWTHTLSSLCTASPDAILKDEGDMVLCSSGYPNSLMNGVLAARFNSGNMTERTEHAISFFRDRGLPMTFFVGPCCTPPELDEHLQRQGLTPGWTRPGMAIDLDAADRAPLPEGLEIHQVEDKESLAICARTFAQGFATGEDVRGWLRNLVLGFGFSPTRIWFLGFLNGRPVSTSLLEIHNGVAGIYCVATLEEARGKGIGTALTREPMSLAKERGFSYAILQSSKLGFPVYEKLGFREYCKIRAYIWSPK